MTSGYHASVDSTNAEARERFGLLLNAAIVDGEYPSPADDLRPLAAAAVARVARQHPDATPADIASAYDIFDHEQRDIALARAWPASRRASCHCGADHRKPFRRSNPHPLLPLKKVVTDECLHH
ncbi:hypothetical protein [Mycobacterium sp. 48b]|uniref:hypothetical protein n=1 Tax=Mycobacterium sp. 48b TaxID=3400426 RepID=UPI003AAECF10